MDNKTIVIAEVGVNHNGSLEMALQLVDAAAEAGADYVKFQTFKAKSLVTKKAPKAQYQENTTDKAETQLAMLAKLELNVDQHKKIIAHCQKRNITFLSTPFEMDSLELLTSLGVPMLKIPSGEITNGPLLLAAAQTGKPIILSTGMSTLEEVKHALEVLAFGYTIRNENPSRQAFSKAYQSEKGRQALKEKVTILHCTTEYPAPFAEVNLLAMDTLRNTFGLAVGYSDHTTGIAVTIAAVARGAVLIEKHFTLNKMLPGPDHKASLEPKELKMLVQTVREVELALGSNIKAPTVSEIKNVQIARKSLVAAKDIQAGELFDEMNLTVKRPGDGLSPFCFWDLLGTKSSRSYIKDEKINYE